jgi:hypothetical protein
MKQPNEELNMWLRKREVPFKGHMVRRRGDKRSCEWRKEVMKGSH